MNLSQSKLIEFYNNKKQSKSEPSTLTRSRSSATFDPSSYCKSRLASSKRYSDLRENVVNFCRKRRNYDSDNDELYDNPVVSFLSCRKRERPKSADEKRSSTPKSSKVKKAAKVDVKSEQDEAAVSAEAESHTMSSSSSLINGFVALLY